MAFAMGDTGKRWAPRRGEAGEDSFWPFEPSGDHIDNFIAVFRSVGYQQCEHGEPEDGLDKVALFVNEWGRVGFD